ncbi:THAP domain-containing protein 1 [Hylaeus volcanicus]|uniref:THAP domain-containing protein 1 n=1 Tax=Hylaeus volcanicus TaxID=313075 RepID=UPI0023B7EC4D|nr:THAP domain-containing protein 1 [Hylaeus volcanicus]
MGKACCIKNCRNSSKLNPNVSFHKFPTKPDELKKFVAAIPPSLQLKITKFSTICSKHFTPESFQPIITATVLRRLKPQAVPTLFNYDFRSSVSLNSTVMSTQLYEVITCEPLVSHTNRVCENSSNNLVYRTSTANVLCQTSSTNMEETSTSMKKDVGVQTEDRYLSPSEEVMQLRNKVRILQKRLQRRETRLNSMTNVIQHLKKTG